EQIAGLIDTSIEYKNSTLNEMWCPEDGNGEAGTNGVIVPQGLSLISPTADPDIPNGTVLNVAATTGVLTLSNASTGNVNPANLSWNGGNVTITTAGGTAVVLVLATAAVYTAAALTTNTPAAVKDSAGNPLQLYVGITAGGSTQYYPATLSSNGTNVAVTPVPTIPVGGSAQLYAAYSYVVPVSPENSKYALNTGFLERQDMIAIRDPNTGVIQSYSQQLYLWLPVTRI